MSDSAARWVDALADRPVPAIKANIQRCRKLLDSAASHSELGDVINRDPGLASLFFRHINKSRVKKNRPLISTITSSLNLLGSEAIQNLLGQARILEDEITDPGLLQLWYGLVLRSYHAARLAELWSEQQGDRAPSEVYIATFLMNLGDFCVAASDQATFSRLCQTRITQPRKEAEVQVLGLPARDIGAELARRWGLPELLQDTLNPELKLVHRIQPCMLAQAIAYEADLNGWYTETMIENYQGLAELLGMEESWAASLAHVQAVRIAREMQLPGPVPAAARLVQIVSDDEVPETATEPDKDVATAAKPSPGIDAREKFTADLKKSLAARASSSDLLKTFLQGLTEHYGFDRCLLMLPDAKSKRLMIRAAPGFPRSPLLSRPGPGFDKPGLFRTALSKVQGLMVNDEVYQTISGSLPEGFLKLTQSANFILFSIALGKKPAAVIYADKSGHALSKYQLEEANRLALLMSKALTQAQTLRQS
ncbi:MAG: HDOD domain-containing protein [Gammaproteobacteria bacterium]|nr:HDOD domain-containing protein [Gammaproteobacteria bacterium]